MSNIATLIGVLKQATTQRQNKAQVMTGLYHNGSVQVANGGYRPINAGDTYPHEGKPVYCIVDGTNCYVVCDR